MKIEELLEVFRIEGINFDGDENFDGSIWLESEKGLYVFKNEKIKFMRKKVVDKGDKKE
jgi:hypothetical protein